MKILTNPLAIKHVLLAIFIIQGFPAIAQSSAPPFLVQHAEVLKLMTDVCGIDEDSRQCELMQFLVAKNSRAVSEGKFLDVDSKNPPGFLGYIISEAASQKEKVSRMEAEGKMQSTRMYRLFDKAKDKICDIKAESQSCAQVLMSFVYQAQVEAGLALNYPANIPLKVRKSVREEIIKEHPDLTRSSRLLVEATVLYQLQEMHESGKATPTPIKKEPERKR